MMLQRLREDIKTVFAKDPAARSTLEVLLCYPGLHAIWLHRFAHFLWMRGLKLPARLVSHISRFLTGVEIHPGATIGRRLFIDHGMGIVMGETAQMGDDCLLYKGVVLGGTSLEKKKRHPTIGNHVVIGSNACVLGPVAVGDNVRIGSGSVVINSVPPGSTVAGVPGRIARKDERFVEASDLDHANLPDPVADVARSFMRMYAELENRLIALEKTHRITKARIMRAYEEDEDLSKQPSNRSI